MGLSNAERQERWRVRREKELAALRRGTGGKLAEARKEITRLRKALAAATKRKPATKAAKRKG